MLELHRVTRDDPRSWSLMPLIMLRIYEFCKETDGETDPYEAVDLIRAWFLVGDPSRLAIWVLVDEGRIIGHTFCTTEPFGMDTFRYVLIRQAKIDKGYDVREETELVFQEVISWAKSLGLSKI